MKARTSVMPYRKYQQPSNGKLERTNMVTNHDEQAPSTVFRITIQEAKVKTLHDVVHFDLLWSHERTAREKFRAFLRRLRRTHLFGPPRCPT